MSDIKVSLTVPEVEEAVREIAARMAATHDDEGAHGMEDNLHQAVLKAIAAGAPDPQGLARAALRSTELKFERWAG